MTRAAFLLVLVLMLPACTTSPPVKEGGARGWHSTWDLVRARLSASPGSFEQELFVGKHLSVHGLMVRTELEAPPVASAEVLIAVDGLGVLGTTSGAHALEPGTIAFLPAGTRTVIKNLGEQELTAVLVRSEREGQGPTGEVTVLDGETAFPVDLLYADPNRKAYTEVKPLGTLPGHLSASVLSVGRLKPVPRHIHPNHDEFLFLLKGWGKLGLGGEGVGTNRHYVSYPMRVRGLAVVGAGGVHGYADEEGRTLALSIHDPVLGPSKRDTFYMTDNETSVEVFSDAYRRAAASAKPASAVPKRLGEKD